MANYMNDKQIKAVIRSRLPGRYAAGGSLYLRLSDEGTSSWTVRYTIHGKRREITLDLPYPALSLADARVEAASIKAKVKKGEDPLAERAREKSVEYKTVDDLAADWLKGCEKRLKHPDIPKRVYDKDIAPSIGRLSLEHVNARDIRATIAKIASSKRPSIANDALMYCKQIFRHGIKLDVIQSNPADAFTLSDAGGIENSRDRALSLAELKVLFQTCRSKSDKFTRDNYLAMALLVLLGVRKGELIAAQWHEFNFKKNSWKVPDDRSKTGSGFSVPLPDLALHILEELRVRAGDSEYVFPNRRASKRFLHVSPDTLNAAIKKLFEDKDIEIPHFTVHDMRRTCRSLLAGAGVPAHVAERCLNHKLKGVEGIYDRYDYFDERKLALNKIADQLGPIIVPKANVVSIGKRA